MKALLPLALVPAALFGASLALAAPAPTVATATAAEVFEVDSSHSSVIYKTRHLGVSWFYGRFRTVSGEVHVDREDVSKSTVRLVVDAQSVDTNDKGRDRHVISPDFLAAKQFREIVFESTKVELVGDGPLGAGSMLKVTGDLTLRGKTQSIEAEVEFTGEGDTPIPRPGTYRAGFETRFTVDPREFGFQFLVGKENPPVGPEVFMVVSIEGIRK